MWLLRLLLLTWFPGVLHAQTAAGSCSRPELTAGFLVSDLQSYPHDSNVAYACVDGFKSAMDGWWGTSTCKDGKWFPEIFCINEKSCVAPEIPHGKCSTLTGWFEENDQLLVQCDQGYRLKSLLFPPQCIKGSWSLIPVCEKKADACDQPPRIPNAAIIHEATQKVFAKDVRLHYKCRDGHMVERQSEGLIACESGSWTAALPCRPACVMKEGSYSYFNLLKDEYFGEGEIKSFNCGYPNYAVRARCMNSEILLTNCCYISKDGTSSCGFSNRT